MQCVVEIVTPLGVHTIAADFSRSYDPWVIEIALRDERQLTIRLCLKVGNLTSQLFEKMDCRGIKNSVHGIDAQSVKMIVPEPHQCVVAKKTSYFVTLRPVEINRFAPRSRITLGEIGTKSGEVVAGRAQVVVDNVENHR